MNLGQIKTRVKRQFGDETGAEIEDADIVAWANEGQIEIARKTKALGVHKETGVTQGENSYQLPTDHIYLDRVTYKGIPLDPTTQDYIDSVIREATATQGVPTHYYVYGNDLFLYPAPNETGAGFLDIWYGKAPTDLVNDADIPELPVYMHKDLVKYCVAQAKDLDEESDDYQRLMAEVELATVQIRDEVDSRQDDTFPSVRLLPGDYG